jgi:hypothetical protein
VSERDHLRRIEEAERQGLEKLLSYFPAWIREIVQEDVEGTEEIAMDLGRHPGGEAAGRTAVVPGRVPGGHRVLLQQGGVLPKQR